MPRKYELTLHEDGLPADDVSHYTASDELLRSYDAPFKLETPFKAPRLYDSADPNSHLIIPLFDGTGNDIDADPLHATNIGTFRDRVRELQATGFKNLHVEYLPGPGTQAEALNRLVDGATGFTGLERVNRVFREVHSKAIEIFAANPNARIALHIEGFSRGGSQAPIFTQLVHRMGLPDIRSPILRIGEDGLPVFEHYLQAPGHTPMSLGLFDPVPTGLMEYADRRPAPSVVSGFQLNAMHERRSLFANDKILPDGLSEDGRFLAVAVPGAQGNVGGGYLRDGLAVRADNLMTAYRNAVFGEELLERRHEPLDPRMNVIHRSEEGLALYRVAPKVDRATPAGQVLDIAPEPSHVMRPDEVVHARFKQWRHVRHCRQRARHHRVADGGMHRLAAGMRIAGADRAAV